MLVLDERLKFHGSLTYLPTWLSFWIQYCKLLKIWPFYNISFSKKFGGQLKQLLWTKNPSRNQSGLACTEGKVVNYNVILYCRVPKQGDAIGLKPVIFLGTFLPVGECNWSQGGRRNKTFWELVYQWGGGGAREMQLVLGGTQKQKNWEPLLYRERTWQCKNCFRLKEGLISLL